MGHKSYLVNGIGACGEISVEGEPANLRLSADGRIYKDCGRKNLDIRRGEVMARNYDEPVIEIYITKGGGYKVVAYGEEIQSMRSFSVTVRNTLIANGVMEDTGPITYTVEKYLR